MINHELFAPFHFFFLKHPYFFCPYLASVKTFDVSSNSLFSLKPPIPQQTESSYLLLYIIFLQLYLDAAINGIGLPWWLKAVKNLPAMQETQI